jgi:hypothetical protein
MSRLAEPEDRRLGDYSASDGTAVGAIKLRRSWGVKLVTVESTAARAVAVRRRPNSGASSPK